jgi:hypothetical protein
LQFYHKRNIQNIHSKSSWFRPDACIMHCVNALPLVHGGRSAGSDIMLLLRREQTNLWFMQRL